MKKGNVVRKDVAQLAGVSTAVVSYVVNNGPKPVSDKLRQRVLKAIDTLGYKPNTVARALALGTSKIIALIVPNMSNPFIALLSHALNNEALSQGYSLMLGDSNDDKNIEFNLVEKFTHHQIDGVIYYGVDDKPSIEYLQKHNIPFVMLTNSSIKGVYKSVIQDETLACTLSIEYMIDNGYNKIAIICGPKSKDNTIKRVNGYKKALLNKHIKIDESLIIYSDYTRVAGYDSTLKLLDNTINFDAIFTTSEMQALGVIKALQERHINIPNDIALMTFNGTDISDYLYPKLSSVRQDVQDLAKKAMQLLFDENKDLKLYVKTDIVKGNTLIESTHE